MTISGDATKPPLLSYHTYLNPDGTMVLTQTHLPYRNEEARG